MPTAFATTLAAALSTAGCTQLLGLDNTKFEPMDAATDAPSLCDGVQLTCTSTAGRSVCGQLYDTGERAGASLRVSNPTGETCTVGNDDGPCGLTVAALPLASHFDGSVTGRLTGVIDDCGRFVVHDLNPAATDIAIVFEGGAFQRTAALVLGRPAEPGTDTGIAAFAVSQVTLAAWATQLSVPPAQLVPDQLATGYLVRYTTATGMSLEGEAVAMNGGSSLATPAGTVPWAGYFAGNAAFAALDPEAKLTRETGTALAVLGDETFSLDGFRTGRRCRIMELRQVGSTLTFVTATDC